MNRWVGGSVRFVSHLSSCSAGKQTLPERPNPWFVPVSLFPPLSANDNYSNRRSLETKKGEGAFCVCPGGT